MVGKGKIRKSGKKKGVFILNSKKTTSCPKGNNKANEDRNQEKESGGGRKMRETIKRGKKGNGMKGENTGERSNGEVT